MAVNPAGRNLFVSVDLPLVPPSLLLYLLQRAALTGAWATVPVVAGRPQPLCAVYDGRLHGRVRAALEAAEHKVMRVMRAAAHREAGEAGWDLFHLEYVVAAGAVKGVCQPLEKLFLNCNTPEDLVELEWELRARQGRNVAGTQTDHLVIQ